VLITVDAPVVAAVYTRNFESLGQEAHPSERWNGRRSRASWNMPPNPSSYPGLHISRTGLVSVAEQTSASASSRPL
jgi:hypothetical protein